MNFHPIDIGAFLDQDKEDKRKKPEGNSSLFRILKSVETELAQKSIDVDSTQQRGSERAKSFKHFKLDVTDMDELQRTLKKRKSTNLDSTHQKEHLTDTADDEFIEREKRNFSLALKCRDDQEDDQEDDREKDKQEGSREGVPCLMEKFHLLVLPCQAGKTFHSINNIDTEIGNDRELGTSLHIVFTMNTILNNVQFASRLVGYRPTKGGLMNSIESGFQVGIFSSRRSKKKEKQGRYIHFSNDKEYIRYLSEIGIERDRSSMSKLVQILVLCSHPCRFKQALKIIESLDESKQLFQRIFLYFDELHQYINISGLREMITNCNSKEIVTKITGITATPVSIWQSNKYSCAIPVEKCTTSTEKSMTPTEDDEEDELIAAIKLINRMEQEDRGSETADGNGNDDDGRIWRNISIEKTQHIISKEYATVSDMDFVYQEAFGKTPFQMDRLRKFIFEKYKDEIFSRGNRVFLPAPYQIVKHEEMKDLVYDNDPEAIVVVINSMSRSIFYERKNKIKVSFDTEMNMALYNIIQENRWFSRAIYFTGNQCVGMGQTLTNSLIGVFTHAVFYHDYTSDARIYQLFGRICGNIKEWPSYQRTRVYCTEYFANVCRKLEDRVFNLAKKYQGRIVSEEKYTETDSLYDRKKKIHKNYIVFDTQEEAIEYGADKFGHRFRKRKEEAQLANKSYLDEGNLPSLDFILRNFGLKKTDHRPRMIMTNEYKWVILYK